MVSRIDNVIASELFELHGLASWSQERVRRCIEKGARSSGNGSPSRINLGVGNIVRIFLIYKSLRET